MKSLKPNTPLIKRLDLYHYWEAFQDSHPKNRNSKVHHLMLDLIQKQKVHGSVSEDDNRSIHQIDSPLLIAFDTLNQHAALNLLINQLEGISHVISLHPKYRTVDLPQNMLTRLALEHREQFINGAFRFKGVDKLVFKSRWKKYYEMLGAYEYVRRLMEKSLPELKLYIGSNDHSGLSQYGFVAARKLGLESLYIQHAAVSDKFPPLRMTYALLDGQDAKDKYLNAGPTDTKIRLIGAMKYDPYLLNPKIDSRGEKVGVCFSLYGHDLEQNISLCEALEKDGAPFVVRFHPAVGGEVRKKFSSRGWEISEPESEDSLSFIFRCHTVVSSDSTILLEAILLKRRPVYFSSDKQARDYYGFAKHGILEKICLSWEEVMDLLGQEFDLETHRRRAKHYHDPLYTEWEGRSTELAIKHIEELTGMELM